MPVLTLKTNVRVGDKVEKLTKELQSVIEGIARQNDPGTAPTSLYSINFIIDDGKTMVTRGTQDPVAITNFLIVNEVGYFPPASHAFLCKEGSRVVSDLLKIDPTRSLFIIDPYESNDVGFPSGTIQTVIDQFQEKKKTRSN